MELHETVPLSYFIDEIMLLDGIEQPMAEDFVRKAVIDFCTKTQIIRRETEIELIECANEYLVDLDPCERVVSIQSACGYEVLRNAPCGELNCNGRYLWFVTPDSLKVSPTPSQSGDKVRVVVAVAPKQDCCEVDKLIYEVYREAIVDKALALLYMVKQARWFDLTLSQMHTKNYNGWVVQAGADRLLGARRGRYRMMARGWLYV